MTKLRWGVLAMFGTVCTATAVAAPKPPRCVPGDTSGMRMFGSGGKAIVCWDANGDCVALDDNSQVKRPAAATPAATVRDDGGKPSACNAKTCKPLGKKLAAAVAGASGGHVTVTSDLAMVAIDGENTHELWNVADDKKLSPKQPATYEKKEKAELLRVEAVGALSFATWSTCGWPCAKEIVVLPDGGNHSKAFDGGDTVALDNGMYAVMGGSVVQVLDKTGRHAGKLDLKMGLAMDGSAPTMIGVGKDEVVVLSSFYADGDERNFAHVTVGTDGKAKIGKTGTIKNCTE